MSEQPTITKHHESVPFSAASSEPRVSTFQFAPTDRKVRTRAKSCAYRSQLRNEAGVWSPRTFFRFLTHLRGIVSFAFKVCGKLGPVAGTSTGSGGFCARRIRLAAVGAAAAAASSLTQPHRVYTEGSSHPGSSGTIGTLMLEVLSDAGFRCRLLHSVTFENETSVWSSWQSKGKLLPGHFAVFRWLPT